MQTHHRSKRHEKEAWLLERRARWADDTSDDAIYMLAREMQAGGFYSPHTMLVDIVGTLRRTLERLRAMETA